MINIFEETKDARIAREAWETRDAIIYYVKEFVEISTEENIVKFLQKYRLPAEMYQNANRSKEHLMKVLDYMPEMVAVSLRYNIKKYYKKTKIEQVLKPKKFKEQKQLVYS